MFGRAPLEGCTSNRPHRRGANQRNNRLQIGIRRRIRNLCVARVRILQGAIPYEVPYRLGNSLPRITRRIRNEGKAS